ncbi:hypothetical protein [Metabacillus iocasae]|uniref:Uncharacterized protein n=1 Tax=Priestia iocasae TaxID=2291674 RepID=A0ABS2QUV3_9BACI|nr:hypothetical protein [Metabacillus iocasae]MBM7703058.1 hypothetical protein [Metabacillus iocasae]
MKRGRVFFTISAISMTVCWDEIFKYIAFFVPLETFYEIGLMITVFLIGVAGALFASKKMTSYMIQKTM